ncbi:tRNA (adenine-N1)-methyltransferase [Metallosphaera hakonensis]|uniref:Methyltransferase domain-containing protein n=1 Tax=Metallosphaera hakonensis JCM 8857 = DSM 7519 TaxID=1293036 RepID=A0A2U9IUL1_9CREN|nr:tRNA (adenine-N1)-methyltransferase [Metallosphaera hakonensis]AWR99537.1 methyltransferase domain-containing protein [Metallosphaera hakonensis JCM 8857 = DSM 7519]
MVLREGDLAVVWIDPRRVYLVKLTPGKKLDTDKGSLSFDDVIGKEYGDAIEISKGRAFIMYPYLDYIYDGLHRPSQVLYPKDIGYMIFKSGLRPGSVVVEAGTGSGFLTISLAHFLGESGKVITYDIRDDMQERAKRNVELVGLSDRVVFKKGDVRERIEEENIDSVFLDMPDPWLVAENAYRILKPAGTIVVFVPTVDQVEKTFLSLKKCRFIDIEAVELLLREYQVKENATRPRSIGVTHTGYVITGRKSIKGSSEISE